MKTEDEGALKALRDGDWLDFLGLKEPKCPHCGEELNIAEHERWNLYDEGEHETECPACEREFTVSVRVSYSYSTESQEGA